MVAVGYADGTVLLVRLDDGAEVLAKKPGAATVSALAWDSTGMLLAWGTEAGEAGIVARCKRKPRAEARGLRFGSAAGQITYCRSGG